MPLKNNMGIVAIIVLFLCANTLSLIFYNDVWWDSAVYIGMGKYIYSLGNAGLWESSRPIIWPLLLGFLWKIGLNVVSAGRVMEILFGGLCILFTYLIGKRLFDEKTGLLSSIFLALSPTFFFFDGVMLTEIVSTFFVLVAIYFFIDKKYFMSGALIGISFMTRFLQVFVLISVFLAILMHSTQKNIKNLKKVMMGFLLVIMPFLTLNQIFYNNALYPFLQQIFLSSNSGWSNQYPISYYFIELFKENFLYLFSIVGLILVFKRSNLNKTLIAATFIVFFIFFNSIKQKEMRFLIVLLPYMYLFVSFSLLHFLNYFKSKSIKTLFLVAMTFSIVVSVNTTYIYYKTELNKNNQYAIFQDKLKEINSDKQIWISNPIISSSSNHRIDKLIYYPLFNEKKKNELIKDFKSADFIFVDSCDLACKPFDTTCESGKNELLAFFKQQLVTTYSSIFNECRQFIFQK